METITIPEKQYKKTGLWIGVFAIIALGILMIINASSKSEQSATAYQDDVYTNTWGE